MSDSETKLCKIHPIFVKKINFACHQSAFAVLREMKLENLSAETDISDIKVTLEASPAFLKSKTWVVDRLSRSGQILVKDRDVELEGGFLYGLTESTRGTVTIRVVSGEQLLDEQVVHIELLARNEWGGSGFMPELLAAFSTPNDPAIDRLLGQASQILRKAGKPDAIDG